MIFLWVILPHIPRAMADFHNANETTAVFEALAFSGIAFMLAALTISVSLIGDTYARRLGRSRAGRSR